MKTCFDQAARDVFKLLPGLDQEVATFWNLDWNTFASIPSPYVKTRITRTTMNSEKI